MKKFLSSFLVAAAGLMLSAMVPFSAAATPNALSPPGLQSLEIQPSAVDAVATASLAVASVEDQAVGSPMAVSPPEPVAYPASPMPYTATQPVSVDTAESWLVILAKKCCHGSRSG